MKWNELKNPRGNTRQVNSESSETNIYSDLRNENKYKDIYFT